MSSSRGDYGLTASMPTEHADRSAGHSQTFRKTATIRATQWFKEGDHPAVVLKSAPNRYADEGIPWCPTLEGGHVVTPGDWIATGVQGEHWPIKPDVFAATYEPVTANALSDIAAERQRQIDVEGWTPEHDDEHDNASMAKAAAAYALSSSGFSKEAAFEIFPWSWSWWKPTDDHRRNLLKAGALIVAEIERLDRAAKAKGAA